MTKRLLFALCLVSLWTACNEPDPISRCVIDRVEVLDINPDYFEDTVDEGLPDLFVELRNAETQEVVFASDVAQEAQVPVNLDFVAVNIEIEDFQTAYEFTVFDDDIATTQDFIALQLPFKVDDHVDVERPYVDITDGLTTIRVHLIWY